MPCVRVISLVGDIFEGLLLCDFKLLEAETHCLFNTKWISQRVSNHAVNIRSLDEDIVPEQWKNT